MRHTQDWQAVIDAEPENATRMLKALVESGLCVHSMYVENCSACRERELERALAVLVDFHDGTQSEHPRGTIIQSKDQAWDFARQTLVRQGVDKHYPSSATHHAHAGAGELPRPD